jgi:hypothetical protein
MKRVYGLSCISLLPWARSLRGAVDLAVSGGYDVIQVLPLRWWSFKNAHLYQYRVVAVEDAWTWNLTWEQAFAGWQSRKDGHWPTPLDKLLFGKRSLAESFPKAIHVVEDPLAGSVLKIKPSLSVNPYYYLDRVRVGYRICWETHYVRERHHVTGERIPWKELLDQLPAQSISLIHIHLDGAEVKGLLNAEETELDPMLRRLAGISNAPVIVEVMLPRVTTASGAVSFLSRIREAIQSRMG